jgi:hypothetical protein
MVKILSYIKEKVTTFISYSRSEYLSVLYGENTKQLRKKLTKQISIYQSTENKYIVHSEGWGTLKICKSLEEATEFKDKYVEFILNKLKDMSAPKGGVKV